MLLLFQLLALLKVGFECGWRLSYCMHCCALQMSNLAELTDFGAKCKT